MERKLSFDTSKLVVAGTMSIFVAEGPAPQALGNLFYDGVQISRLETLPGKEKFNGDYATSGDAQDLKKSLMTDQTPEVSGVDGNEDDGFSGDIQLGAWHTREGLSLATIGILGTPVEYLLACFEGEGRENAATAFIQQVAIALLGEELGQDNYGEQWG